MKHGIWLLGVGLTTAAAFTGPGCASSPGGGGSSGDGGSSRGDAAVVDAPPGSDVGGGDAGAEAGRSCTADPNALGTTARTVGGRPYVGYAPMSYDKMKPGALVVGLHGAGQRNTEYLTNTWQANADTLGFLVVAPKATVPDGLGFTWQPSDASLVLAAVDDFRACYAVDPTRVILDGSSAGGMMSYWMGLRAAGRFSGISIDSADLASGEGLNGAPLLPSSWPIPVSHFHGTGDTGFRIGWAIDGMDRLVDAGHPFSWHPVDGGHGVGDNPADALQRYKDLQSSTGPGEEDAGTWPSASDGGPCNALQNTGAPVPEQAVAALSPMPAGGAYSNGTYVLTAMTQYTGLGGNVGPTGRTVQWTIVLAGQAWQDVVLDSASDAGTQILAGGLATEGSAIAITQACPWVTVFGYWPAFDADGTHVTLYTSEAPAAGAEAAIFTKQ